MKLQVVDEKQAAEALGVRVRTLQQWRWLRKGPAYLKIGRAVRYQTEDLYSFLSARRIEPEAA